MEGVKFNNCCSKFLGRGKEFREGLGKGLGILQFLSTLFLNLVKTAGY